MTCCLVRLTTEGVKTVPPDTSLRVGAGNAYRPAQGCPVASEKFAAGEYMAHQGDADSFVVALASVKDYSAAVRLALWTCVHCGTVLVGLGDPGEQLGTQEFAWFERSGDD